MSMSPAVHCNGHFISRPLHVHSLYHLDDWLTRGGLAVVRPGGVVVLPNSLLFLCVHNQMDEPWINEYVCVREKVKLEGVY